MILNGNEIKAFAFDMDGTLVCSTWIDYLAWKLLFDDYNIPFHYNEYVKILGVKSSEVIKIKLKVTAGELSDMLERKLKYFKDIVKKTGIETVPYAETFLKEIRNKAFRMALATGARREKFDFVFQNIKFASYFDAFVTGDDVKLGKPDPEIFIKAAKKLGILPSQMVVIEDARNGVQAAKRAGCKCIAITTTTAREDLSDADLIIDSYQALHIEEIMRSIFPKSSH